jgi:hypothetical protein
LKTKFGGFKWKYQSDIISELLELPGEEWKVCTVNNRYQISSLGRVKGKKIITQRLTDDGYKTISFQKEDSKSHFMCIVL